MPEKNGGSEEGRSSGPRPFWSGTLAFGLVSVPVRLFSASRSSGPSLRMVADDGTPLSQRYVCPREEEPVSADEIVRGYEIGDGEWITVTDEELESLEPEKAREIDLRRFVPLSELDPAFFDRAYFLVPAEGATKAYRLLVSVMEETERAGIATFVMRGREHLVAILAEDGFLRAETMRFHDEVRTAETVGLPDPHEVDDKTTARLMRAIEKRSRASIDREELEDTQARALESLVARKRKKGKDVVDLPEDAREDPSGTRIVDLIEVLKRSLAEEEDTRETDGGGSGGGDKEREGKDGDGARATEGSASGDLEGRTRAELYERAKSLEIPGRSSMSKKELVEALERAS